jgi:hypothetical protein
MSAAQPLFRRILGARFDELPIELQRIHDTCGAREFSGRCAVTGSQSRAIRVLAHIAGLPRPSEDVPIHFSIACTTGRETWTRQFGEERMRSALTERHGRLVERLGLVQLTFALDLIDGAIVWRITDAHALGLRLPLSWFRNVTASAAVETGRYTFDVRVALPWVGPLVAYRGWLET